MTLAGRKHWISAAELQRDSLRLARRVIDSGFAPTLLLGIWRGGAPVAVFMHEALVYRGISCEHLPLRSTLYRGLDARDTTSRIHGLETLRAAGFDAQRVLLVDDVFDSGITVERMIAALHGHPGLQEAEIRIATPWWKPARNRTTLTPDYWLYQTEDWLVFPHEMCGLEATEILQHRPQAAVLFD